MDLKAWTEAQRAVIGALLIDPDQVSGEVFLKARPEHFGDASLRNVFTAARDLWDRNRPIDAVTVLAEAGQEYYELIAGCIAETPTASNVAAYLEIVRDSARLNALQEDAMQILSAKTAEAAAGIYEHMGELLRGTEDVEDLSVSECIGSYLDRMQDKKPTDYLSWGIDKLNEVLYISPGKFVVLAADSSVGKTALALQFAWHMAAKGKRVGFFSLETDTESLTDRLMAEKQTAGIPLPLTKTKRLEEYHIRQAAEAGIKSDRIPLRFIRKCENVAQIRARTVQRKFDVIFIDYVQLLDAPGRERWDIVTNISISLHRMAQQLGVTVIGLSQITPAAKGSKAAPTKDDLRESRQLKQDADAILILSPCTEEDAPPDARMLEIAKNKDGKLAKMLLQFEPQYMTFSYVPPLTPTMSPAVAALFSEGKAVKAQGKVKAAKNMKKQLGFEELEGGSDDLPF